jgi:2-dehydro-3-deoxygalactonokinase
MMTAATNDPRLHVRIAPGLSQADPPDVMRGEETQIAGYLTTNPDFVGVLCLPGTHTKWVRVDHGRVLGFSTFMSGELFAILSAHSTLRYGMSCDGWNESMFLEQLARTLKQPETLTARLFGIRARSLLQELPAGSAQAALSGQLLGIELAGTRSLWQDNHMVIIGKDTLAKRYAIALASQGVSATTHSGDELVLTGLAHLFSTV